VHESLGEGTGKAGPGDEEVPVKGLDRKQERVGALFLGFGDLIDGVAIAEDFLLARIARKGAQTVQIL
jgi:hypothetical protein